MKNSLGDRMKEFYEKRTKLLLPRRTYTIIRIDGKAFHTYTKGLKEPFDEGFIEDMDETACYLCKNIQGAKLAFVQSDEISILLTDFDDLQTQAWFDGNIQKITSISASLATAKFNQLRLNRHITLKTKGTKWNEVTDETFKMNINQCIDTNLAMFDSRVFTIPSEMEVNNYFIWRQQDTVRNSILSTAHSLYSQKEMHNKKVNELQEMCFKKGINWNDYPVKYKKGRLIVKETYTKEDSIRNKWVSINPPTFTQDQTYISNLISIEKL